MVIYDRLRVQASMYLALECYLRQYLRQRMQKGHLAIKLSGRICLVAGIGFEPMTFGL